MFAMADGPHAVDVTPDALRELRLVASFRPEGVKVKGVAVRGGLAYVAAGYGGLFVVDASHPGDLTLLGSCDTPGNATEVALRGRYAYVADRPTGIQIIDVDDPANPRIVGLYDTVELATGLDIAGNLLAICNRSSGIEFADITDPTAPRRLGALRLGEAQGIRVRGDLAYVGLWHNR
ncbi:MAG: LVIVD repeat-containing protein, partial [Armatimonadota bacterium]